MRFLRLVPHPVSVPPNVLRQTFGSSPVPMQITFRVRWREVGEFRRDFACGFRNQHRNRVQVRSMRAQSKSLCFQRNRAASAKWIADWRYFRREKLVNLGSFHGWRDAQVSRDRACNFPPCVADHVIVVGVFPNHQPFDDFEEPLAFLLLRRLSRELVRYGRRVVHKLCKQHRATSCERPSCPPQVKCRRVPAADRLLAFSTQR